MNSLRIAVLCMWGLAALVSASASPQTTSSTAGTSRSSSKKKRTNKRKHATREPSQKVPTPERITEIQSALARGGYYQGDPDGKWDSNTVAAVEKFQSAHGIDASGKLDAPTLQKLGLGSDIAGVSAPKPVTPPAPASQPQSANPPTGATLAR